MDLWELGKYILQQLPNEIEHPAITKASPKHTDRVIIFTGKYDMHNNPIMAVEQDVVLDNRVLQYSNKKSQLVSLSSSGPNGHNTLSNIDFNKNIAKVKNKLPSKKEISRFKQVVKKQTLYRYDQNLPCN